MITPELTTPANASPRQVEFFGIDRHTVDTDFVMQAETGLRATFTDQRNRLATLNALSLLHQGLSEMRIEGPHIMPVIDLD